MVLVAGASSSNNSFVVFFYRGQASTIVNNGNVVTLGADGSGNYTIQNNLPSVGLRYAMIKS